MANDISKFKDGNILYFTPFFFTDAKSDPKPKYFLILKHIGDRVILSSLPTSKDAVPNSITKQHGCLDDKKINFNCYYFSPDVEVCTNGFKFPKETYVYGFRLQEFDVDTLLFQQANNKTTINLIGTLTEGEYFAICQCLKNSYSVKNKYRRVL